MKYNTASSLSRMIDVNTPIIYIQHYDFARVDELLSQVLGKAEICEWNPATGGTNFATKEEVNPTTLEGFLKMWFTNDEVPTSFLVLKEVQDFIHEPAVKYLLQMMSQRKLYDPQYECTIIIVSTVLAVPQELEKYITYLEVDYPDEAEINRLIEEHIETNHYDRNKFSQEDREKLMPSLKGMTPFEIDRMLDMAMSSNGSLSAEDKQMILQQKKQMVRKSGLLELVDTPENMDSIGGLDALKKYLQRKAKVIQQLAEAQKAGVSIPKGIFIVGMPGCGKSLCAKATASLFEAPLLRLDMGSMMGKYVGDSESNLRKALRTAEAAAPCVLWIDEIEKAFSGVGGDHNDVLLRMFGYFLSWLQDKQSAVYVVATANNANRLPPELKRKGRFDEIFCVNLPNEQERRQIFEVHLKRRNKDTSLPNGLLKSTEGFNGADIESVVTEAIENCFLEKQTNLHEQLTKMAGQTVSISLSCREQIKNMQAEFKNNCFKDATTGKIHGRNN